MKIDKNVALDVLREEARFSETGPINTAWEEKIEKLSKLCADGISKTHIAFLGTTILAKSVNAGVDVYAIKPKHAVDNANAYSARALCHSVLVPAAAEFGFSLGVTGREPLNNQPYFRMTQLGDNTPVHIGGRAAFDYMLGLIKELSGFTTVEQARAVLRAFLAVRRRYQPRYTHHAGKIAVVPEHLTELIERFVQEDSEGGKRAQAIVAALLDVFAGTGRVESGRINDPSRHYPGDVCVRMAEDPNKWEKAFEVRDKPVTSSDIQIFGKKCIDFGVREAAVVMVANRQPALDTKMLSSWASSFGIGLTLFQGWPMFVEQTLFWSEAPKPEAAILAAERIEERLVSVEASPEAVTQWQLLIRLS